MGKDDAYPGPVSSPAHRSAISFLVDAALRTVKAAREADAPRDFEGWIGHLAGALMSKSETSHTGALAALMATGVSAADVMQIYVPAAARRLGELWVADRASFVDVTVGAARLQALLRSGPGGTGHDGTIPLGHAILLVIPACEQHSLGAFVAADQFRRHGLWVHMGIGLTGAEIARLVRSRRFSLLGLSVTTRTTLDNAAEVVDHVRATAAHVPPIVIGGRIVSDRGSVVERTGADHAVKTAREAVEKCGLSTVAPALTAEASVWS